MKRNIIIRQSFRYSLERRRHTRVTAGRCDVCSLHLSFSEMSSASWSQEIPGVYLYVYALLLISRPCRGLMGVAKEASDGAEITELNL